MLSFGRDTPSRALLTDFCRCAECKLTKIVISLLGVVTLLPCNATKSTVRLSNRKESFVVKLSFLPGKLARGAGFAWLVF